MSQEGGPDEGPVRRDRRGLPLLALVPAFVPVPWQWERRAHILALFPLDNARCMRAF